MSFREMLDKVSGQVVEALIFSLIGLVLFAIAFVVVVKIIKHVPSSVRKEIEEDQNIALAIIIAAMILGISWIVAAAIH
jgi:putative membrane protein